MPPQTQDNSEKDCTLLDILADSGKIRASTNEAGRGGHREPASQHNLLQGARPCLTTILHRQPDFARFQASRVTPSTRTGRSCPFVDMGLARAAPGSTSNLKEYNNVFHGDLHQSIDGISKRGWPEARD
jgi:hypothetical protein